MKLYVIRHGETNMGKSNVIATTDEPLNSFGIQQAIFLREELLEKNIDFVYCSPIERAKHTLELFDLNKKIPVIIDERIKERNMGIYEKVSFGTLDWQKFWSIHSDLYYSQLESMKDVYKRVSEFLDELKEHNKDVLLVTHGGIIRAINWYFQGFNNSLSSCENCKIYDFNIN